MKQIAGRYLSVINRFLIGILCASSLSVSAAPALKLNILASYPFGYIDENGKRTGTYWEYIQTLNQHLTFKVEQEIVPKARVVEHLKLGLADAAILFRSQRLTPHVEFVSKIREIPIVIVSKSQFALTQYNDLHNADYVGHFRSGSVSPEFDVDEKINKVPINTYPQMIKMLEKDRVQAIVGNGIVIQSLISKQCLDTEFDFSTLAIGTKEQWLVMSKKSKQRHTLPELKYALDKMKSQGILNQIFDKHLSLNAEHCRPKH